MLYVIIKIKLLYIFAMTISRVSQAHQLQQNNRFMYRVTESPLSRNDRFPGENNYCGIVSSLYTR